MQTPAELLELIRVKQVRVDKLRQRAGQVDENKVGLLKQHKQAQDRLLELLDGQGYLTDIQHANTAHRALDDQIAACEEEMKDLVSEHNALKVEVAELQRQLLSQL